MAVDCTGTGKACADVHVSAASDDSEPQWVQAAGFLRDDATIAHVTDVLAALLFEHIACSSSFQGHARAAKVRPQSAHMYLLGASLHEADDLPLSWTVAAEHVCADHVEFHCTERGKRYAASQKAPMLLWPCTHTC